MKNKFKKKGKFFWFCWCKTSNLAIWLSICVGICCMLTQIAMVATKKYSTYQIKTVTGIIRCSLRIGVLQG